MQREAARLVRRATNTKVRLFGTDITEAPLIRSFDNVIRGKIHGKTGLGGHRNGVPVRVKYRASIYSSFEKRVVRIGSITVMFERREGLTVNSFSPNNDCGHWGQLI